MKVFFEYSATVDTVGSNQEIEINPGDHLRVRVEAPAASRRGTYEISGAAYMVPGTPRIAVGGIWLPRSADDAGVGVTQASRIILLEHVKMEPDWWGWELLVKEDHLYTLTQSRSQHRHYPQLCHCSLNMVDCLYHDTRESAEDLGYKRAAITVEGEDFFR